MSDVEAAYERWLANPTDGELLADLFEAATGKRPIVIDEDELDHRIDTAVAEAQAGDDW